MKRMLKHKSLPLSELGELELIQRLKKQCPNGSPHLTGIGDDTAVIPSRKGSVLVTTDMLIEGVHFDLSYTTLFQLGHKFLAVNISDIFAMGGNPTYFFISIGVPKEYTVMAIEELYSGIIDLATRSKVIIAGGDTCSSRKALVLSGTIIGYAVEPILRSGARPGDGIYVTDTLGDSSMGLRLLQKGKRKMPDASKPGSAETLMRKHLMPHPAPLRSRSGVNAMIDISDGLLQDLSHICNESRTGAVIYEDLIPLSEELQHVSRRKKVSPLQCALKGGEDYCLLFTSSQQRKTGAYRIGEITKRGKYIIDRKGRKHVFKPEGYEHFK